MDNNYNEEFKIQKEDNPYLINNVKKSLIKNSVSISTNNNNNQVINNNNNSNILIQDDYNEFHSKVEEYSPTKKINSINTHFFCYINNVFFTYITDFINIFIN